MRSLLVIAIVLVGVVAAEEAENPFDFRSFFAGEWEIEASEPHGDDVTLMYYSLVKENHTEGLIGHFTDAHGTRASVRLDFENSAMGSFYIATGTDSEPGIEDEDDEFDSGNKQLLFRYNFKKRSNGVVLSADKYGRDKSYQFVITTPTSFVMAVADKKGGLKTFTGRKTSVAPLTFWEKYGKMIMIFGGMLIFQTFSKQMANSMAPKQQ